ncbi:hypothetical protein LTR36_004860 [Oleoguttula mirabilis]|uniref:Uncharacterized protein n=1 Tax=Oleoguttula mirabilis TaxID=1507867 RepID=A0AAV9JGA4_9PEZI|nr:hypothetical protein LTR36_004860 [Oleoguttula mirabilis]
MNATDLRRLGSRPSTPFETPTPPQLHAFIPLVTTCKYQNTFQPQRRLKEHEQFGSLTMSSTTNPPTSTATALESAGATNYPQLVSYPHQSASMAYDKPNLQQARASKSVGTLMPGHGDLVSGGCAYARAIIQHAEYKPSNYQGHPFREYSAQSFPNIYTASGILKSGASTPAEPHAALLTSRDWTLLNNVDLATASKTYGVAADDCNFYEPGANPMATCTPTIGSGNESQAFSHPNNAAQLPLEVAQQFGGMLSLQDGMLSRCLHEHSSNGATYDFASTTNIGEGLKEEAKNLDNREEALLQRELEVMQRLEELRVAETKAKEPSGKQDPICTVTVAGIGHTLSEKALMGDIIAGDDYVRSLGILQDKMNTLHKEKSGAEKKCVDAEEKLAQAEHKIEMMEEAVEQAHATNVAFSTELSNASKKRSVLQDRIDTLEQAKSNVEKMCADAEEKLAQGEHKISTMQMEPSAPPQGVRGGRGGRGDGGYWGKLDRERGGLKGGTKDAVAGQGFEYAKGEGVGRGVRGRGGIRGGGRGRGNSGSVLP